MPLPRRLLPVATCALLAACAASDTEPGEVRSASGGEVLTESESESADTSSLFAYSVDDDADAIEEAIASAGERCESDDRRAVLTSVDEEDGAYRMTFACDDDGGDDALALVVEDADALDEADEEAAAYCAENDGQAVRETVEEVGDLGVVTYACDAS